MALHIRQDDKQTDLQKRIAADLQDKARNQPVDIENPDGVEDSRYVEGTKQTTGLAFVWVVVAIAAVGIAIWLVVSSTGSGV